MKKTEKAWVVVDIKYPYVYHCSTHRSLALKWRKEQTTEPRNFPDIKVIPATLTYELPKKKSLKKGV